jgi:hypothetical protein
MVISCNVVGWEIRKALMYNCNQANIIFLHAFDKMGINPKQLQPTDKPLFGFGGKATLHHGKISLPLSFGTGANVRIEPITLDVVNMSYQYNAILGKGPSTHLKHQSMDCTYA